MKKTNNTYHLPEDIGERKEDLKNILQDLGGEFLWADLTREVANGEKTEDKARDEISLENNPDITQKFEKFFKLKNALDPEEFETVLDELRSTYGIENIKTETTSNIFKDLGDSEEKNMKGPRTNKYREQVSGDDYSMAA